jgi:hypothetical protein
VYASLSWHISEINSNALQKSQLFRNLFPKRAEFPSGPIPRLGGNMEIFLEATGGQEVF